MNYPDFLLKISQTNRPVVVDFWAPWCIPCKAVKPTLEKLAQEYAGRVDLWEINADENRELLHQLKIYGIPTLIGYRNTEERMRSVGVKPQSELKSLFEALSNNSISVSNGLSVWNRFMRLLAGGLVAGMGWASQYNWFLLVIGGILMFSAVYERCPLWKTITTQLKKIAFK